MCLLQSQQFKVTIMDQGSCVNNLSTQCLVRNNIISWNEATHFYLHNLHPDGCQPWQWSQENYTGMSEARHQISASSENTDNTQSSKSTQFFFNLWSFTPFSNCLYRNLYPYLIYARFGNGTHASSCGQPS